MAKWSLVVNGHTIVGVPIESLVDTFKVSVTEPGSQTPKFMGWVRKKPGTWEFRGIYNGATWTPAVAKHKTAAALFALWSSPPASGASRMLSEALCPKCGAKVMMSANPGQEAILVAPEVVGILTEDGRRVRGRVYHTCRRLL